MHPAIYNAMFDEFLKIKLALVRPSAAAAAKFAKPALKQVFNKGRKAAVGMSPSARRAAGGIKKVTKKAAKPKGRLRSLLGI